jgi:transposase
MTTKILALTDALGNLVRFVLLPGHRFDTVGVAPLIDGIAFGGLIADKAFDSNAIIANLNERGAKIVISQHPRRALPLRLDTELYKWRHLIENFFCKLKEFKRIAWAGRSPTPACSAISAASPTTPGLNQARSTCPIGPASALKARRACSGSCAGWLHEY